MHRRWQVDFSEHGPEPLTRETMTLPRLLGVKGLFTNVLLYRRLIKQRCEAQTALRLRASAIHQKSAPVACPQSE